MIKPKADWRAVDSPKKRMDEFVLFTFLLFTGKKNKFVHSFFGRIYCASKLLQVLSDLQYQKLKIDFERIFDASFILIVEVVNVGHYNAKKKQIGDLEIIHCYVEPFGICRYVWTSYQDMLQSKEKKPINFLHIIEILLCIHTLGTLILTFIINQQSSKYLKKNLFTLELQIQREF